MTIPRIQSGLITLAALATLLTMARPGEAQAVDPGGVAAPGRETAASPRRSWELPALGGEGQRREEDLVGDNRQPRWTAHDGFGQLDVYVLPKGTGAVVYELRPTLERGGRRTTFATEYQAEFGLPGRLQLGVHAVGEDTAGQGAPGDIDAQAIAVRWAVAEWGTLWGNPTIEGTWKEASRGADAASLSLLLGGHLASGWHWATNLSWRRDVGESSDERAWTSGVNYVVKDSRVALGVESRVAAATRPQEAGSMTLGTLTEVLIGPSLQLRPTRRLHIALVPLVGSTQESPTARAVVVAGLEF